MAPRPKTVEDAEIVAATGRVIGRVGPSKLTLALVAREVALMPVLLGAGIPLLPPSARQVPLTLTKHRVYEKSGTVALEYTINRP